MARLVRTGDNELSLAVFSISVASIRCLGVLYPKNFHARGKNSDAACFGDFTTRDNSYHFQRTVFFCYQTKSDDLTNISRSARLQWNSRDEEMSRAAY